MPFKHHYVNDIYNNNTQLRITVCCLSNCSLMEIGTSLTPLDHDRYSLNIGILKPKVIKSIILEDQKHIAPL